MERKADNVTAGVLKESGSYVAALDGTMQVFSDFTQKNGDRAESLSFRDISLNSEEEDKAEDVLSFMIPTNAVGNANVLQVPRSFKPRKAGSEASQKPFVSSPLTRAQMTRASAAASASREAFSLLLVDDNVSRSLMAFSSDSTDDAK